MNNKEMREVLLNLSSEDYEMVIEGLEALKSKDFAGEIFSTLAEGLFFNEDTKKMTSQEKEDYENSKREREEKRRLEQEAKAQEQKELKTRIEVLKSKIILMREMRKSQDFRLNSKKLNGA